MLRILGACFVLVVYLQWIDATKVEEKDSCLDKDGDTQTLTHETALSDKRYDMLIDLLMEERRSRTKLETAVTLLALKQEVAKCQCGNLNRNTYQSNDNGFLLNETKALKEDGLSLQKDYHSLKSQFAELVKSFEAQSVLEFHNETKHLEETLQITNTRLNVVTTDVYATKQDCIKLFNKVKETEQLLENKTKSFEVSPNVTACHLRQEILQETRQERRNTMANKVALTACKPREEDVKGGGIIKFTDVKTVNGINNLNSIRNSGIFTCEKSGIYLISVFIKTNTRHGAFIVKKNGNRLGDGVSSITDFYQTTSVTLIQHLDVNDIITVTGKLFVYGYYQSCLTIVQIQ